uniref:Putative secreted protein n=1 Tax=Anopheles triannulatus TaxID=58253 RepID=A0A2M4B6F1_9DIPT
MVHTVVYLVAFACKLRFADCQARIVHETIEPGYGTLQLAGKLANGLERGQIELHRDECSPAFAVLALLLHLLSDLLDGCLCFGHVAARHYDGGLSAHQRFGGLVAEPRVGTGDDEGFVTQRKGRPYAAPFPELVQPQQCD